MHFAGAQSFWRAGHDPRGGLIVLLVSELLISFEFSRQREPLPENLKADTSTICSDFKDFPGLGHSRRRASIFTCRNAGQRYEMPPAQAGTCSGKFLNNGSIIFFGVECTVFADGVA